MRKNYRSLLRKLSPHGFYALLIILLQHFVPSISFFSVHSLDDKVADRVGPMQTVERVEILQHHNGAEFVKQVPGTAIPMDRDASEIPSLSMRASAGRGGRISAVRF